MSNFKLNNSFDKRRSEAQKIRSKYIDRVPVIAEVSRQNKKELTLDKCKYLIPYDLTVGQFMFVIRKRIKLPSEKALFIFFNDKIPPTAAELGSIHKEECDEDGFLYATISLESTFG